MRLNQVANAERAFQKALEIDGDSAEAHMGLAVVRLRQRRNRDAAEQAMLAVSLQHSLPLGHFYLGMALVRLQMYDRATLAFETSASMLPGFVACHRWLAALYGRPGGNPAKAAAHRDLVVRLRQREVRQTDR